MESKQIAAFGQEFDNIRNEGYDATNKLINLKKKMVCLLARDYGTEGWFTTERQQAYGFSLYEGDNPENSRWFISVSTNIRDDDGKFKIVFEQDKSASEAYAAICYVAWSKVSLFINDLLSIVK